jgi:hypothetical protein
MSEPVKCSFLIHDRAKTILQNSDMWSSASACKNSAETLNLLASGHSAFLAIEASEVKNKPVKPQPAPAKANESEAADA